MKEIEFRSFDNKTNKFEYWSFPENKYDGIFWEMIKRPEFEKPQQSTGLKDKHGKMIFEGDIVKFWNGALDRTPPAQIFPVVFKDCNFIAGDENNNYWLGSTNMYDIEIIGNIHQDKHLLKS